MATVADLYAQALGRPASQIDPEGLAYWTQMFGPEVDKDEAATFLSVAKVIEPEVVKQTQAKITQAPDLDMGLFTPAAAPAAPVYSAAVAPKTVNELYQTFYGTPGNAEGLAYWGGANKTVSPKDAASWLLWAGKDPNIANKSTGITVDQAYETYLGFKPDDTARNYWTGGDPNKELTTAELAAITSEAYGLNPQKGNGIFGSGIGPDVGWVNLRDNLEAAAVVGGNYFLPGSSLLTSQLVTEGAKEALASDVGLAANAIAGAAGGYQGNVSNYGKIGEAAGLTGGGGAAGGTAGAAGNTTGGTGTTMLDYSAPTSTGGLGLQGTAALDGTLSSGLANTAGGSLGGGLGLTAGAAGNLGYMGGAQGLTAGAAGGGTLSAGGVNTGLFTADNLYNSTGGLTSVGPGTGTGTGLTASQVIKAIPLVTTINNLVGDPLGLQPKPPTTIPTPTGFGIVPIPEGWRSPTNNQGAQTPIDLSKIFTDQNLLIGTQWEGLPNQRNLTFNDIFASGQQSTPMGTPVNINNLVSAILGQTSTS